MMNPGHVASHSLYQVPVTALVSAAPPVRRRAPAVSTPASCCYLFWIEKFSENILAYA
jgi:hypothetical protein